MALKQQVIDYIMNLDEDFSVHDIIKAGFNKSVTHSAKVALLDARAIFNVGCTYSPGGELAIYNTTYRSFDSRPIGTPITLTSQIMEYMLWLNKDFTVLQVQADLGLTRNIIYQAKTILIDKSLIFHVKDIHHGNSKFKVFSKTEKEFKKKHVDNIIDLKISQAARPLVKKAKHNDSRKRIFNPADPLAGFAVPR